MNLNQANLNQARQLYDQGNLEGMYNYLALNCGDRYAVLAKGVVTGDTISGKAAIEFMENTAEQQGRTLSESDLNQIRTDMAKGISLYTNITMTRPVMPAVWLRHP